jgi:hypothetical protein
LFSTLENFNIVHRRKRGEKIIEYLRTSVAAGDRKAVVDAMAVDLRDLRIEITNGAGLF